MSEVELEADPREGATLDSAGWGAAAEATAQGEVPHLRLRCAARGLLACAWRTLLLCARRRIHQPVGAVGRRIAFADGTSAVVYRETTLDRPPAARPAVLVVCFRLRWARRPWAHGLFRLESELNTILFAGFPGMVSKLWLGHDERGVYRGFYQWDGPEAAVSYVSALRWVLGLVSEPGSIHYAVLPGLERDAVLADPGLIGALATAPAGWWRPTDAAGRAG
jgi:hypothetical protein